MRVVIAGGHGKIGRRPAALLAARGDVVIGVVRNPDHIPDLDRAGAEAVVCDLEATTPDELAVHLVGADAVVFAAGAGPGSGVARKDTVDRRRRAARRGRPPRRRAALPARVLHRSGRRDPEGADEAWAAYLQAKKAAEESVRAFDDLDWTVLFGRLTDDPGTGRVLLSAPPVERGT